MLSHSKKSNHLLSRLLDTKELSNTEIIFALHQILQVFVSLVVIAPLDLASRCLNGLILGLLLVMSLCELRVDDRQGQVEQEESSNENQRQKVDEDVVHVSTLHHALNV